MTTTEQLKSEVIVGLCFGCGAPCTEEELVNYSTNDKDEITIYSCKYCKR